jgi:hypothetical protein
MTTPRLTLITIVATLAYLGLAILGWGGFAAFFSYSALIALAIVLFALSGYLGLLVNSLGWALAFRSGVGILLTALLIPPLIARIRAEEQLLRTQFGGEYNGYRTRTSRLIPGLY